MLVKHQINSSSLLTIPSLVPECDFRAFRPHIQAKPTQKGQKQSNLPREYLKTPMELVQTFCTIEFAIVENPQNHLQNQKYHSQKKLGLPEFNLTIFDYSRVRTVVYSYIQFETTTLKQHQKILIHFPRENQNI